MNIWRLLCSAERQWRTRVVTEYVQDRQGFDHPVVTSRAASLDMATLAALAPAYGIDPDQSFFEKLHAFETACLTIWAGLGCTPRQKEKCTFEFGEANMKWTCANCNKNSSESGVRSSE